LQEDKPADLEIANSKSDDQKGIWDESTPSDTEESTHEPNAAAFAFAKVLGGKEVPL